MLTENDVIEFIDARRAYKSSEERILKRVKEVAVKVADLKVFRDEDVCIDPDPDYAEGQVFEDGLEIDITDFWIKDGELCVSHTDLDPAMCAVPILVLKTVPAYLWDQGLFEKEILEPLSVFEEKARIEREESQRKWRESQEALERRQYEKLKEKFETPNS